MSKLTLLVADNAIYYRDKICSRLTNAGYEVLPAGSPDEVRSILREHSVDVILLDLRLEDDNDPLDVSGLSLARQLDPAVPKIIVSSFDSFEAAREALSPRVTDGLGSVVRYVRKRDGFEAILTAVHEALELTQKKLDALTTQISAYHDDARREAHRYGWIAVGALVAGIVLIFYAGILTLRGGIAVATASAVAGMLTEAIALLAFRRSDSANARCDRHRQELFELHRFELLLAAAGTLGAAEQSGVKAALLGAAAQQWLVDNGRGRAAGSTLPPDNT